MSERPESAAIRKSHVVSPALGLAVGGCLLGTVIAAGGLILADRQQAALDASAMASADNVNRLQSALTEVSLTAPRLRLEELADLPLVPEYLFLAQDAPDSTDTHELRAYLETVLDAAVQETGLSRLALISATGDELIVSEHIRSGDEEKNSFEIRAAVEDYDGSGKQTGHLTGSVPESKLAVLSPQTEDDAQTTASTVQPGPANAVTGLDIPGSTRFLSLIAGLATALFALFGAAIVGRSRAPRG